MAPPMRKGPWTEQEDLHLVCFVGLFGDRRWDFIAQVSGLNRTGKSCRLRWVNYLHPGLKRGRMSPQEERLILELHSRWGNRWSRIARKLPGRTDNEIKNYWRTHMRKKAQERKKKALASPSPSPTPSSSSSFSSSSLTDKYSTSLSPSSSSSSSPPPPPQQQQQQLPLAEGGPTPAAAVTADALLGEYINDEALKGYFMDQIGWDELAMPEAIGAGVIFEECKGGPLMPSPMWEYCSPYSLWKIDDESELEF